MRFKSTKLFNRLMTIAESKGENDLLYWIACEKPISQDINIALSLVAYNSLLAYMPGYVLSVECVLQDILER